MGQYRGQFLSMIVMIAIGIGIFVGFNMEWYSLEKDVDAFLDDTLYADYRLVSETGFTREEAETVASLSGVTAATRFMTANLPVTGTKENALAVAVCEEMTVSTFLVERGDAYDPADREGIWLSVRYADGNGISVGDTITFPLGAENVTLTVRGLIRAGEYMINTRDETQLMPGYDTFGYAYVSPRLYEEKVGAYYPQIHVRSDLDSSAFSDLVNAALGKTTLVLTRDESTSYAGASGEIQEGKTMSSVLPLVFLVIGVLTMVTTMHRLTAREKTQIGTLKALGFKDRRIVIHYTSYAFAVGLIGIALGIGVGFLVARLIMDPAGAMGSYLDMPSWKLWIPGFIWAILAGILLLLTLIGFLSVKQMLRGTAADALRPYEPARMKPMSVERTKWFHRLGFGNRWNLRDILRHKARTAMSLIGIIGCTVLVVGSLGVRDTMSRYLDTYYSGAMRYATRIYLDQSLDSDARASAIARYDGDASATLSIKIGEHAVSLDIYNAPHDYVRFPGDTGGYADLSADGAYVCRRIADREGLRVGDTVTLSPYGLEQSYTVRVCGVVQSLTESVIISHTYADTLGIPYQYDSVYTAADAGAIKDNDPGVGTPQAKQTIIDTFDSFMKMMNLMVTLLIVAALILGLVVLYNLGVMSYTERYREMATLKVLGFRDRKIASLLIAQNLWVTLVGVVLGIPGGCLLLSVLMKLLASEYEMNAYVSPLSCLAATALTLVVSLLVSLMVAAKNRKIDMVEALKCAE